MDGKDCADEFEEDGDAKEELDLAEDDEQPAEEFEEDASEDDDDGLMFGEEAEHEEDEVDFEDEDDEGADEFFAEVDDEEALAEAEGPATDKDVKSCVHVIVKTAMHHAPLH